MKTSDYTTAHRDIFFVLKYSLLKERKFDMRGYQGIETVRLEIIIMLGLKKIVLVIKLNCASIGGEA